MRKKGFTLVELLVVIAIIALLMGILMPALARVRVIAYRMVCGTNLSGIGKAVMLYAGDAREEYPMPGITKLAIWAKYGMVADWWDSLGGGIPAIYDPIPNGAATIGSLFYLLVKYEDTSVKQFNCKGDSGVKTFKLSDFSAPTIDDFTKAWDFGSQPGVYNSYSYHMPFALVADTTPGYPVTSNSPPASPLAADRNPTLDTNVNYITGGGTPGGDATDTALSTPCTRWTDNSEYKDPDLLYNSFAHQSEGQNVLYNDGHVRFEKQANCGVNNDNIWQRWPTTPPTIPDKSQREACGLFIARPIGTNPAAYGTYTDTCPVGIGDALLVNEQQSCGTAGP